MRFFGRRRSFWTFAVALTAFSLGGAVFSRLRAQEGREEKEVAPGLTLLSVSTTTTNGPLRYWLVKATPAAWKLGLEIPDLTNNIKKRSVRELALQSGATVAVNGGFFAYTGAAVGAVKQNGEWHRLPWKTRTALAWNDESAQFGPLGGAALLTLGATPDVAAALNGFSLPGSHTTLTDGFAILTPHFAAKYKIGPTETGVLVQNSRVTARGLSGDTLIPTDGYLIVGRGAAVATLNSPTNPVQSASYTVRTTPADLDAYPQILGAGPRLVENDVAKTNEVAEEFRPDVLARGPRTCVGWDKDHNWLLFVADGRQTASAGLTIPEVSQLFHELGAVEAMNLDGGSSTQLVINGEVVNAPSGYDPVNPLRPREVQVINALTLKPR